MINNSTLSNCKVLELNKVHNISGNISVVEGNKLIPFGVKRIYYLYDVPGGADRGGHAHKNLYQLVIAASGSFDVILDDGASRININLNHPYKGLLIVPGIWRELTNFSSGSICLVLASELYDNNDYIREYNNFLNFKNDSSLI
jgi:hypothetical protein